MLGKCFGVLCSVSFVFAIICGNTSELCDAILAGASKSVTLCISLIGIMALWGGVMAVLKEASVIKLLSRFMRPILKHVFPRAFSEGVACEEITACISASLLGIANATTPLALASIEKMNEGRQSKYATNDMITLAVLGSASFNLIPTTVLALRADAGASIKYEILAPIWLCSLACGLLGVLLSRLLGKINGDC